jgi:hypothetical protein
MANLDYQAQLTQIYNKLASIQGDMAKLAQMSNVNTIQVALQSQLNSLAGRLNILTADVESLTLTINNLIIELRSR